MIFKYMIEVKKRVAHNKLTWGKVLEQFKEVHGDNFDYSNSVYVDTHTKIEIKCKKHDHVFWQIPKNHKKGCTCPICEKEKVSKLNSKGKEKFIEEVFEKYGDRFDLSLIEYVNNKTPIKVICKFNGIIEIRPDSLLAKNSYIPKDKKKTKSNNKEIFIQEARKIYSDKDDYTNTEVISSKDKIHIRCTKHDYIFKKSIQTYLAGWGCPKCSAENYRKLRAMPKDEYYKKAEEVHDNKYTYNGDYTTLKNAVTFFCPEHGKQKRNASAHIKGTGCKNCDQHGQKTDKVSKFGYVKLANGRPTSLYLIRCYSKSEEFYKIGKTFRGIKERFTTSSMPYNFEIIYEHIGDADYIWDLEEKLHIKYKAFSQKPRIYFAGFTECYKLTLPIKEIIESGCQTE